MIFDRDQKVSIAVVSRANPGARDAFCPNPLKKKINIYKLNYKFCPIDGNWITNLDPSEIEISSNPSLTKYI